MRLERIESSYSLSFTFTTVQETSSTYSRLRRAWDIDEGKKNMPPRRGRKAKAQDDSGSEYEPARRQRSEKVEQDNSEEEGETQR